MRFKQPKVSTRTREALLKRQKIKDYLKGERLGAPPKLIALHTGIKHNTAKTIVLEMADDGELNRLDHPEGYYAIVDNDGHGIFLWNWHNLIITFESNELGELDIGNEPIIEVSPLNDIVNYRLEIYKSTKKATFRLDTDYPHQF